MSWNFFQSSIYKFYKTHEKKILGGAVLFLASINFLVWEAAFEVAKKAELEISFFDVGQGDAIFIESKDGTQILIDGGPPNRILPSLGREMSYFDRFIDVVILTHPHADHISGLLEVLERYEVGMVIESGADYHTAEAKEFEKALENKSIKRVLIDRPVLLNFFGGAKPGSSPSDHYLAKLRLIYPDRSYEGEILKNVHDSALVGILEYGGKKILLMSDAEKKLEQRLVSAGAVGDVDVLKVGHHGSKTSSHNFLLNVTKPEYAVISVGRNRYGHPHPDVLSRLASVGAKIFRTDIDGTVKLEIRNGNLIWK